MNIIVTGASGFIGNHLINKLCSLGHHCICLTRQITVQKNTLNTTWLEINPNFDNLEKVLFKKNVEGIFHLAGAAHFKPETGSSNLLTANIASTFYLLDYAKNSNIQWFTFASTGSVYGPNDKEIESCSLSPNNLYGASKLASEQLISAYNDRFRCLSMRIYFPYGPNQPKSQLIANLISKIRHNQEVNLISSENGFILTPTYIDDIVNMFVNLTIIQAKTGIINAANHEAISLKDLCLKIGEKINKKVVFNRINGSGSRDFFPNISKLKTYYATSLMTPISQGLNLTLKK